MRPDRSIGVEYAPSARSGLRRAATARYGTVRDRFIEGFPSNDNESKDPDDWGPIVSGPHSLWRRAAGEPRADFEQHWYLSARRERGRSDILAECVVPPGGLRLRAGPLVRSATRSSQETWARRTASADNERGRFKPWSGGRSVGRGECLVSVYAAVYPRRRGSGKMRAGRSGRVQQSRPTL